MYQKNIWLKWQQKENNVLKIGNIDNVPVLTLSGPGPAAGGPTARAPGRDPAEGVGLREAAVCARGGRSHCQAHEASPRRHDCRGVGPPAPGPWDRAGRL